MGTGGAELNPGVPEHGGDPGTALEDRPFRPDVEGLRAVAVTLVVLYHVGWSRLQGGFVGVDVFFVISGFVITGILLREQAASGTISLINFYGRRARRIIPAATVVVVVTVALAYLFLGTAGGNRTAVDGRWATLFVANLHFISTGTDYLSSGRPPSPLLHYWSLAVEEQFYLVYPALFLVLAGVGSRRFRRMTLTAGLIVIFSTSFAYSILDTSRNPVSAYFSPFTRAWELALGAIIAAGTPLLRQVPRWIAGTATWVGLAAVVISAVAFGASTPYPGSLVGVPVLGAGMMIAGGVAVPRRGTESLLGLLPFRALGKLSYSLYLWHWPVLIIAAEHGGQTVPSFPGSLAWLLVAVGLSILSYFLVENPIRRTAVLRRTRWRSVGLGVVLVAASLGIVTLQSELAVGAGAGTTRGRTPPAASLENVLRLVAASGRIRAVPAGLLPPVSVAASQPRSNLGRPPGQCLSLQTLHDLASCTFGDREGRRTAVLYGDSHAGMWFPDIDAIAIHDHWKLVVIVGYGCPLSWYPQPVPGRLNEGMRCNELHRFAVRAIKRIDPDLVIVAQAVQFGIAPERWRAGLVEQLQRIRDGHGGEIVIGSEPVGVDPLQLGPDCLDEHVDDVQACAVPRVNALTPYIRAEESAAAAVGARYIDVTPWFCADTCGSVIGRYDVYFDAGHVAVGYQHVLEGVLASAIDLPGLDERRVQ